MRRTKIILTAMAGLGLALAAIPAANADAGGNRASYSADGMFTVMDLCPFPVTVTAHVDGAITTNDTGHGSIQRIHTVETDTYQAASGGPALTGTYTFEIQTNYDADGNPVSGFQTGVIVRVPLPDGSNFQVSGRADALNATTDYIAAPTHGVTKNLDGLCAALS